MKNENIFNIPNLLSFYRLVVIPYMIWCFMINDRQLFIILISLNFITDVLDGIIARTLKICTEFGAKIDSISDVGTFLLSISGLFVFEKEFILDHYLSFYIVLWLYIVGQMLSLIKFKKATNFNLYSNKFSKYIQGIFIVTFFVYGYSSWYFYSMIVISCFAQIEVISLVLLLPRKASNVKSIFLI